jgi:hypothetical protein
MKKLCNQSSLNPYYLNGVTKIWITFDPLGPVIFVNATAISSRKKNLSKSYLWRRSLGCLIKKLNITKSNSSVITSLKFCELHRGFSKAGFVYVRQVMHEKNNFPSVRINGLLLQLSSC